MPEAEQREPAWAEFPQRKCRQPFTLDGLIDHTCDLPDQHPGPDAARSSKLSTERRLAWEDANPGWEKTVAQDDPFADLTQQLKERS